MSKKNFLVDLDLNGNQLLNTTLQNLATHPSGKSAGFIYYNTAVKTAYIYDGASWVDLGQIYVHPTFTAQNPDLSNGNVLASITTNSEGHVTGITTRVMKTSQLSNDAGFITLNDGVTNTTQTWSSSKIAQELNNINSAITGGLINKGGYDVGANSPNLDVSPIAGIKNGWTYVATTAGNFFTEVMQVGDMIIANKDTPTVLTDWTIVQKNVDQASSAVLGLVTLATATEVQTGTDSNKVVTPSTLSARTATETRTGIAAIATQTEATTGADDTKMVTPLKLKATLDARVGGYAATIGDGSATSYAVTHSLNTLDVVVQVVEVATGDTVETQVTRTSTNVVTVSFNTAPTANKYRVVIKK